MSAIFVTGAGTDIGKTYASAALVRARRAAGRRVLALKPIASGLPHDLSDPAFALSDTAMLLAAQGKPVTPETVAACSPWRFEAPLAPDMAARAERRALRLDDVVNWCREQLAAAPPETDVLIEGVGGVMSPIADDALNLDLIEALACPVVLVGGSYLGGLSHMLTALETLKSHGVAVGPVILNESAGSTIDFAAAMATLGRFAAGVRVIPLRQGGDLEAIDPA